MREVSFNMDGDPPPGLQGYSLSLLRRYVEYHNSLGFVNFSFVAKTIVLSRGYVHTVHA
jgi:hypothetical protein